MLPTAHDFLTTWQSCYKVLHITILVAQPFVSQVFQRTLSNYQDICICFILQRLLNRMFCLSPNSQKGHPAIERAVEIYALRELGNNVRHSTGDIVQGTRPLA